MTQLRTPMTESRLHSIRLNSKVAIAAMTDSDSTFDKKEKDDWSPHELGGLFTHHAYRFSTDTPVNVGRDPNGKFVALMSGESWSFTREVSDFPQNAAPGDQFRYGFKGAFIDWWDWGQDTVVWVNGRAKSQNNERRPKLVVPASKWVDFELLE